jgi:hypothetical protein
MGSNFILKFFSSPGVYAWVRNSGPIKAPFNGAF